MPFVAWFNSLDWPQICISKETQTWDTTDGKTVISKHPPIGNILYGNIEAISFVRVGQKKVTNEDIATVIKQNNYSHLHLQTIASHLSQLEDKVLPRDKSKEKVFVADENVKSVLIKPPIMSLKGFNTSIPLNEDFLECLTKKLGTLKITNSIKVISEESKDLEGL